MSSANELWEIYEHRTLVITNELATQISSASRSEEHLTEKWVLFA